MQRQPVREGVRQADRVTCKRHSPAAHHRVSRGTAVLKHEGHRCAPFDGCERTCVVARPNEMHKSAVHQHASGFAAGEQWERRGRTRSSSTHPPRCPWHSLAGAPAPAAAPGRAGHCLTRPCRHRELRPQTCQKDASMSRATPTTQHRDLRAGLEKIYADLPRRHRQTTIEDTMRELSAIIAERDTPRLTDERHRAEVRRG